MNLRFLAIGIWLLSTTVMHTYGQNAGDIIITEIMFEPDGSPDDNAEWIEVYNTTAAPIDMNGWIIDDDNTSSEVIVGSFIVPANSYAVLFTGTGAGACDAITSSPSFPVYALNQVSGLDELNNEDDLLIIYSSTFTTIAQVDYNDPDFPQPLEGQAIQLDPSSLNVSDYADAANWCAATGSCGTTTVQLGSPGSANPACAAPIADCSELFISEYGEGSSGNAKYIELFNPTTGIISLGDYDLGVIFDGGSWSESLIDFAVDAPGASIAAGDVYVIANNVTDVPGADLYVPGTLAWNGDDAVGLIKNGVLIDAIGNNGSDPGTGWSVAGTINGTVDQTLQRKSTILNPNTDWDASRGTNTTNSEWTLSAYVSGSPSTLGNHSVSGCSAPTIPVVGFDQTASTALEIAGTHQVSITMDVAPSSNVTVAVVDNGVGTASGSGIDYTFASPTNLTFTTGATYPNTQTVSIGITSDALSESGESFQLGLSVTGGTANLGTFQHDVDISDLEEGLVVNEFSNGTGGVQEYVELVVVGVPGSTVDISGWILDDNNGDFSGGSASGRGIAPGYIAFEEICPWEKVPVGSIIVLYNASDPNATVPANDPTDENGDYVYVVPVSVSSAFCSGQPVNDYIDANNSSPNSGGSTTYGAINVEPCWGFIGFRNSGDAVQLRRPDASFYQGISYGSSPITAANHPLFSTYGNDVTYFSGSGSGDVYFFDNSMSDDFNDGQNWTVASAAANQTPGVGNNIANTTFINNLRSNFPITSTSTTDTCILRESETRFFTREVENAEDEIYLRVTNNSTSIDHGEIVANVFFAADGGINAFLTGKPYFHSDLYEVKVANTPGSGNYDISIFLSQTELNDLTSEFNAALTAAGSPNTFTNGQVLGALQIIKRGGALDPALATADSQVDTTLSTTQIAYTPGPVGADPGYIVTGTFTSGFSQFRLAVKDLDNEVFPVEWLSFTADAMAEQVLLKWETASEVNNDRFVIERSKDQQHFEAIGMMEAAVQAPFQYQFIDPLPYVGDNYYRLRQIDLDGTFSFSPMVWAKVVSGNRLALLATYPNPATNSFWLELDAPQAGNAAFRVVNPTGKVMTQQQFWFEAGPQSVETDLTDWSSGYYLYELRYQGQVVRGKILKQ